MLPVRSTRALRTGGQARRHEPCAKPYAWRLDTRACATGSSDGAAIVEPVGTAPQTLPGARKDGTLGLWLEKKSPARGKGWQKRWFVFQADGEVRYFTDPSKENLGDAPAAGMYGAAQTPKKKKQVRFHASAAPLSGSQLG